ncbi:MAG: bifunctional 3-demethylubiquinol 3-O-methyltransferase/2-polyprenyl-6-hydroxyphenol methylase, partial [Endozoicomonas sp.]
CTHEHSKFIKPSELCRDMRKVGLDVSSMTGMTYNPLTGTYKLNPKDVSVNYLIHGSKSTAQ